MNSPLSPMMAQWHECKEKAGDALLLFRLGDFYEAFHDDAILIAKELDLTLTKRQDVPMAGVPFHASEGYIEKLVSRGFRVAIAEQMENPQTTKGLVKREIVQVITPGTLIHASQLSEKSNQFLGCITQINATFGLSVIDITTADFRAVEFDDSKLLVDELCRLRPKELLIAGKWKTSHSDLLQELAHNFSPSIHFKPGHHFSLEHAYPLLTTHFQVHHLDGMGLQGMTAATCAAGAILEYLHRDLSLSIEHIRSIQIDPPSQYMKIDRTTQRNLELVEPLHKAKNTLLHLLDHTKTPMGGRLLKDWISHPLLQVEAICLRQDAIEELTRDRSLLAKLSHALSSIRDLTRLIMRIETGHATPRDLAGLRFSLEQIPQLCCTSHQAPLLKEITEQLTATPSVAPLIASALVDAPPLRLTDGNLFKPGFSQELDAIRSIRESSHSWIAEYQTRLRNTTQIKTLKVGYTKAFGFYIEVSRGQSDRVPEEFQRKQTLVNAERFITPELKEYEYQALHAEERMAAIEQELFHRLRKEIAQHAPVIRQIAQSIGILDCLLSLALAALQYRYTRPIVDHSTTLHIEKGRHPVVESLLPPHQFIPNEVFLNDTTHKMRLITGPNMAGKSTYIRQVALLAIMAQIGSFIPAQSAHIGIIDQVFSRIGASDDLSRGQSTFMVEMAETANILRQATSHSLVILDEIGRGTSTYDGISVAWAVAEYLLTVKSPKTLFATHYCELTDLARKVPGVSNYCVAVHESDTEISFLHQIIPGSTDKSYGIHVGKLAGLPAPVIRRATEILAKLEKPRRQDPQLSFLPAPTPLSKDLQALDPNALSPLDALKKLMEWKEKYGSV